jgi:hypothetical protein
MGKINQSQPQRIKMRKQESVGPGFRDRNIRKCCLVSSDWKEVHAITSLCASCPLHIVIKLTAGRLKFRRKVYDMMEAD